MNSMNKKCNRNKLFALCMSLMLVFSMLFTTAGFIQNVQAAEYNSAAGIEETAYCR